MSNRQQVRRAPCVLCLEPLAGAPAETGATWHAHRTCYRQYAERALERPDLLRLPPDELRQRIRDSLTRSARRLYARRNGVNLR